MVIVGGFNCYPAEIEKTLLQHPQISDVAVVGAADERLGEVTHAHIVADNLTASEVIEWARLSKNGGIYHGTSCFEVGGF